MDWFLYDNGHRHERVKMNICSIWALAQKQPLRCMCRNRCHGRRCITCDLGILKVKSKKSSLLVKLQASSLNFTKNMNFFASIFQSFIHQEKNCFVEHISVIASVLLLSKSIFFLFFKNIIRDGFYQRGVDLPRVKQCLL